MIVLHFKDLIERFCLLSDLFYPGGSYEVNVLLENGADYEREGCENQIVQRDVDIVENCLT
jgi:hypothetical protein